MRRKFWVFLVELLFLASLFQAIDWWRSSDGRALPGMVLEGQTLAGKSFDSRRWGETPGLVYFWAEWCPVCRYTSPAVNALVGEVPVVSVAAWSDGAAVQAMMAEKGYRFPVLLDEYGERALSYGLDGVPAIFIVRDGRVVGATSGYSSEWGLRLRLWLAGL